MRGRWLLLLEHGWNVLQTAALLVEVAATGLVCAAAGIIAVAWPGWTAACARFMHPTSGCRRSWELPGLEYPHDLALVPAPLEVTGAGAYAAAAAARLAPLRCGWVCTLHCRCRWCMCLRLEVTPNPHPAQTSPVPLLCAGERLLAVLVGETKDSGQNMHKFVLTPPGVLGFAGADVVKITACCSTAPGRPACHA